MMVCDINIANIHLTFPIKPQTFYLNIGAVGFVKVCGNFFGNPGLNRRNGKNNNDKHEQQYDDYEGANYYFPKFFDTLLKF